MPAASEPHPLPRTFRPYGVRIAAGIFGLLLAVTALVMWFAFPPHIRAQFTVFQIVTILFLALLFYGAGFALARSRVVARTEGLVVVNGYLRRRYEWNEVLAVSLRPGSPWAVLDLSDGTTVPAMGIQGSDGKRARAQVRELRALVDELSG
ncbi:MAG: PH domain-containing protein [Nocardioidaceae bacterium]|nr:PH domain-containing protein [Nocardioidaceae bacterium]NUS52231.1 PH domain-containing protein [Nocardioidaceae bacterium]